MGLRIRSLICAAAVAAVTVTAAACVTTRVDPGGPSASAPRATERSAAPTATDRVYTVSELLAARAAGTATNGPFTLRGYWSYVGIGHSCAAPDGPTGELEIYCHEGESGITERDEPTMVVDRGGYVTPASGPMLTPWVPYDIASRILLAPVNGQPFPPVPIVVRGHFDDPRAADCRPAARKTCEDRFVVDELVDFDIASVPTPAVTPTPSPFPFDSPPAALFDSDRCQPLSSGTPPGFSFVGWKPGADLHLTSGIDLSGEAVFVAIARDVVPLGDWFTLSGADRETRPMGRLVCYAHEWEPGAVGFDSLAGTAYRVDRQGNRSAP